MRKRLRAAIKAQGPDFSLAEMFKRFDFNGDGCFSQQEFESAFIVMEIGFKSKDLRRLIELGDKNKDGVISFDEFNDMLYGMDVADSGDEKGFKMESDSD